VKKLLFYLDDYLANIKKKFHLKVFASWDEYYNTTFNSQETTKLIQEIDFILENIDKVIKKCPLVKIEVDEYYNMYGKEISEDITEMQITKEYLIEWLTNLKKISQEILNDGDELYVLGD